MESESSSITSEYRKSQKIIALVFFIIIVIATIVSLGGVVWTIADFFIGTTGKLAQFLALPLGWQIAIVGGLLAGLFFLLVFFFGLFKKTSRSLIHFIYKKRELEERYKNRINIKIAAWGLLISLIGLIGGAIFAILWDIITRGTGGGILTLLGSTGPIVLFIGIGLYMLVGITLGLIYFWRNGYYLILKLLGGLEKEKQK
ncbi:MAG: hypothetical protein R3255_04215 [Candidatus Lokiarchaeia archaeon]|nr:hypothetical protein [Candidatus Lokiarchaeia archaeon]